MGGGCAGYQNIGELLMCYRQPESGFLPFSGCLFNGLFHHTLPW